MSSAKKGVLQNGPRAWPGRILSGWGGGALCLLLLALVLFFYRLGHYPLFDLDEPRYAEAAREMLARGDWITPYFNDEVRFDKPVFFYWLVALAYKMFGVSEFSARFFSAVTATLSVLGVYAFGSFWMGRRYGFLSALILATSALFIGLARMSITDMTLSLWMTATTLCLFLAAHRNSRWLLAAGAFAGLGALTKGPVALAVPGGIFMIYTLLTGSFRRSWFNIHLLFAAFICLVIALPWYALAYQANGPAFLEALFLHNVTRFSDVVSGHRQPVYFYGLVLIAGFLPWTTFLPAAIRQLQLRVKTHRERVQQEDRPYLLSLYAAIWVGFVLIFFTVSHTKLLTYILPLFPALALWIGETLHAPEQENLPKDAQQDKKEDAASGGSWRWLSVPAWIWVAVMLVGGAVFTLRMDALLPREAAGVSGNLTNALAVLLGVIGAALSAWLLGRRLPRLAVQVQALAMALVVIVALRDIVPNVSRAAQGTMLHYLARTGGTPLVLYEIQRPSLTFYGRRRVPRFVEEQQSALLSELAAHPKACIITRNTHLPELLGLLPRRFHAAILEKDAVYSLLAVHPMP